MSYSQQDNQPQAIANDAANLNNANTYGVQSTDSASADRTQAMDTSSTSERSAKASDPAQHISQDNQFTPATGGIGVGSSASDYGTLARANSDTTTGGPLRSNDISVAPDTLGTSGGSNYADSASRPNARRAGSEASTPPGEEQGTGGAGRPNPPITDLREQADPSQP